ncbi:MAG: GFA family protein [Pseudomonadota bacterium]
MIRGSCHCGQVRFSLESHRDFLTDCNCSVCRRYAALWLHCNREDVELECPPGATRQYIWGDELLGFHSCVRCGCITHWSSNKGTEHMAVNARLVEPEELAEFRIRRFDGAESWEYLD